MDIYAWLFIRFLVPSFPRRRESRPIRTETYRIKKCLRVSILDSRLRGNDGSRLLRPFQTTFVIPVTVGRALMPDLRFFRRPLSFQLRLKLPFRAHAYASGALVERVLAVGAGNEDRAAAVEHVVGVE